MLLLKDFKIQIAWKTLWKKGEIAHFEQFHLFPHCFPKAFFFCMIKLVYMEERVNTSPNAKTLDVTKFKALADDKLNVPKMTTSL